MARPADDPALQVYFLAAALPGLDVENPRQVSAWRYPRKYGPKSPLFSRGTILRLNGSQQFLISGTASVVGHQTHHENQVANQLSESLRNVQSLLEEGQRLTGDSHARLDSQGMLKVYIRNPADLELIQQTLEARGTRRNTQDLPAGRHLQRKPANRNRRYRNLKRAAD